tara:strand:+ start:154 stop:372 length:219 start_codon:yes stop_codon:yes gene_type:complete
MSDEDKQLVMNVLGNGIMNQLNINGILEACRLYSTHLAENQYAEMSDDDKEKALEEAKKIQEQLIEQQKQAS